MREFKRLMIGSMLECLGGGGGKLTKVKPGLMFLLRLAWDCRTRLPLLIMSGFLAMGVRIQMEINIDRATRYMPRLRLEDEAFPLSDEEEIEDDEEYDSEWTTDAPYDSEEYDLYDFEESLSS
ncbi:uncharacterized protein LOC106663534 [Cimex lectularius]|uniref:Uncharacterized protein n=1 Tax=Cimex lectularius TaxID=79782 RepID=A0A8I6RDJ7_CIMLE|nr:uncharacterized protein LOC106663534 [Cimex lectularius]XP_014243915.1 uncharacterized protein LOC106663534 [Cimex lectularius]